MKQSPPIGEVRFHLTFAGNYRAVTEQGTQTGRDIHVYARCRETSDSLALIKRTIASL